jgi:DNA invertase Pin-like site-specific DNA recombinase
MGIDTRTPMGKAMAHMAVVFAELERDLIRMRTREALQVKKENGVTLGRPRSTPDDVVTRVVRVPPWAVPQRRRSGRCRHKAS